MKNRWNGQNVSSPFQKRLILSLLLILGPFSVTGLPAQEGPSFKIIVHSSNSVSSITKEQASKFFLKKMIKWGNGQPVLPVDLNSDSPVRERFSKEIHGKSVTAIKAYWHQKIFTGRDVPPPEKLSDTEVLQYVLENIDAIGYISETSPAGNVKVLKVSD